MMVVRSFAGYGGATGAVGCSGAFWGASGALLPKMASAPSPDFLATVYDLLYQLFIGYGTGAAGRVLKDRQRPAVGFLRAHAAGNDCGKGKVTIARPDCFTRVPSARQPHNLSVE